MADENDQFITSDDEGLAGPVDTLTIEQSQATTSNDDQYAVQDIQEGNNTTPAPAADSPGVGAGTATSSYRAINNDDGAIKSALSNQYVINNSTANLNKLIPTQPNQLDQYASYTYAISWYLLSIEQFNSLATQRPNVGGWQLLMQSGGAPSKGRSPAFPLDYYMDDLEIETLTPGGGTNRPNSATSIKFKVTEPNGITLLQSIFNAVKLVYNKAEQSQTNTTNTGVSAAKSSGNVGTPNYLQAHYCLVIEFYGYDSNGNLVAPAKGSFNTSSGYTQTAVIQKYYPFKIRDIKFSIANRAIEYTVTGQPFTQAYALTTDRGTIPFPLTMTGETVDQLLNGPETTVTTYITAQTDVGTRVTVADLPMNEQAAIAAGTDPNAVTDSGMAFGGGGL